MAKERSVTRSFQTAVVRMKDGTTKEFPNIPESTASTLCETLGLEVESVTEEMIIYGMPESVFLKYATRR